MRAVGRAVSMIVLAMLALGLAVPSQSYIYSGKRRKINCGVLLLDNNNNLSSDDWAKAFSLFSLLDQRVDLKPSGWSFENPLAPFSPSVGGGKLNPDYWTVNIRAHSSLTDLHILYLPARGHIVLEPEDREKLRQFVDNGGVLWIDNAGVSGNPLDFDYTFFIPDMVFQTATPGGFDVPVLPPNHPLLSMPFQLSPSLVAALGDPPGKCCIELGDPSGTSEMPLTFDTLYAVVMNTSTGKASIAANAFGSGRVVATANFLGRAAFENVPSLMFAYNVVAWSASWTHPRKDPRHSGYSIDTVGGGGLLESWVFRVPPDVGSEAAAVIYKNVAFYSAGSSLYALDLWPQEDLDYDGNPDDGFQENGAVDGGQDLVWAWTPAGDGGRLTTPTVVTAQNPANTSQSIEAVMVMSSSGKVYMLEAFPYRNGRLASSPGDIVPIPPFPWDTGGAFSGSGSSGNQGPFPPVYVNGWIYAVDSKGKLQAYNPALEKWATEHTQPNIARWSVPDASARDATPKAGPTFGWVKNESNNAMIGVVYWGGTGYPDASGKVLIQCDWVYGVPVFVSNDKLRIERTNPTQTFIECRTALSRVAVVMDVWNVRVTRPPTQSELDAGITTGVPIPVVRVYPNRRLNAAGTGPDVGLNAPGSVVIETSVAVPPNSEIVATYAVNYSPTLGLGTSQPPVRRWLEPVTQWSGSGTPPIVGSPPATLMVGNLALGPGNMIYLCGDREMGDGGCSIYGLKNDGTLHSCNWNYEIHSGIQAGSIAAGSTIDIPPVIFNENGLPLRDARAYGSPAVAGNKVFVAVSAKQTPDNPDEPSAAILCFKANHDFVIRITEQGGFGTDGKPIRRPKVLRNVTGAPLNVKIWQPNIMPLSGGPEPPPPPNGATQVTSNLNMTDYDAGTITFTTFDRPKLKGPGGTLDTNTFTPSLPVWVYLDNVSVPIDFTTWAPAVRAWNIAHPNGPSMPQPLGDAVDLSRWNNLLWYYIVPSHKAAGAARPCSGIHSSPVVIGNMVYFVCDDGFLHVIPTEPAESSGGQVKNEDVPTPVQVCTSMGTLSSSIAGSNGVVLIPGSDGLHAFTNEITLVADSGRIMEIDGAGEAGWSIDTLSWPASVPTSASNMPPIMSGPVNKPARAKYVGPGEILVVNTGANQICKIDKSGTAGLERIGQSQQYIRWVWDRFEDPKHLLRPGQPTELLGPTDAHFWKEYENGALVVHCLIADSGNHRIVDLVYRIALDGQGNPTGLILAPDNPGPDPNTGFYRPELNWVSVTESMNERYVYECIQIVRNPGQPSSEDIWAAISNYRTGTAWDKPAAAAQGLGGAIVALRYRVRTSGSPPGWNYAPDRSGQIVAACDRVQWPDAVRPLSQPKHFQVLDPPLRATGRCIIICDSQGVYEIGPLPASASGTAAVPRVRRALLNKMPSGSTETGYSLLKYYSHQIRPVIAECDNSAGWIPFEPPSGPGSLPATWDPPLGGVPLEARCVQELRNGNWLITNGYAGADTTGAGRFSGEVFEIAWDPNDPTKVQGIKWNAPRIYCDCTYDFDMNHNPIVTGINPTSWRQKSRTTYTLRQPASAFRQF